MYVHTTHPREAEGAVPSARALAHDAQHLCGLCASHPPVEVSIGHRKAARTHSGKHVLGQVLLKRGLLLSKRLDVSRLRLESDQGEESFWRRSPFWQSEGNSHKLVVHMETGARVC